MRLAFAVRHAVVSCAAFGAALHLGLTLGQPLLPAALAATAVSAWGSWAWRRSFLAIHLPCTSPISARLFYLLCTALELVGTWVWRWRFGAKGKSQRQQRLLDGYEASALAAHEVNGAFLVSNVVTLEPPVSAGELREAADEVARRHTILQAVVVPGWWPCFAVSKDWKGVEVQELDCSAEEAVELHMREGLPQGSYCWRLGLCGPDMILTYHHAFLDGTSVMTLLEELLATLHAQALGAEPASLAPAPDELELPVAPRMLMPWHARLRLSTGCSDKAQAWRAAPAWPSAPGARGGPWQEERMRYVRRRLSPGAAERLRSACRSQGTSVAGALGAALLREVGALVSGDQPLLCRTYVNVRPHYSLPPHSLGPYIGWVDALLEAGKSFWEDARRYKAAATELMHEGRHLWVSACWPARVYEFRVLLESMRKIWASPSRPAHMLSLSFGLSNRGSFRLEAPARRVTAVHFVRQQRGFGQEFFELNVCTVNGTLCLTLTYYDLLCPDDVAEGLLDSVLQQLVTAAEADMPATQ